MFEMDDLQERIWSLWCRTRSPDARTETKRTVGRATLEVDVVVWGPLTHPAALDVLPAGVVGIENKAPSVGVYLRDILRFLGKMALLLERELQEGRRFDREQTAGLVLCSRLAPDASDRPLGRERLVQPGHRVWDQCLPALHVIEADALMPTVRNAPLILYCREDWP